MTCRKKKRIEIKSSSRSPADQYPNYTFLENNISQKKTMHNLNITNILVITYKKEFNNSYRKNYAQVTNAGEFPCAKNLSNVMVVHCENLI